MKSQYYFGDRSDGSDRSDLSETLSRLLPEHGGYRKLRSFQVALQVYDASLVFCDRFIGKRSRTHDQMVQAARSGVQNIAEGSMASGTSKKTELKLTNVARASLEELMRDYEDFLRQRNLRKWDKNEPEAIRMRTALRPGGVGLPDLTETSPEVAANALLCLINQASYLLHQQLKRLESDFLKNGGFTERLYQARSRERATCVSEGSDKPDTSDAPACPTCGRPMRLQMARQGPYSGQRFWGCTSYPDCKGTRHMDDPAEAHASGSD